MAHKKTVRPVYDERDREIDTQSKSRAWDFAAAAVQLFTIMCVVKGNPAWVGGLALLLLGMAANLFFRYRQYRELPYLCGWLSLGAAGAALLLWFGFS